MPRRPRLDAPATRHHVMNRGARREVVFPDASACAEFIGLLSVLPERDGTRVHGFAVMPNHFHLVLSAGRTGLGPALQFVQSTYSLWLNHTQGWDGPVWKGRFRSRPVMCDDYWRHLLAYVHLNPVAAGLVHSVDSSLYTSHHAYAGTAPCPEWLTVDEHLELFGSAHAYRGYVDDLVLGRDVAPADFDPGRLWRSSRRALPAAQQADPEPTKSPIDWPMATSAAWLALELVTGANRVEICSRGVGRSGNPAWWLALWWLPRARGVSAATVAAELNIHRSGVTHATQRLRARELTDPTVRRWVQRLKELLPGVA